VKVASEGKFSIVFILQRMGDSFRGQKKRFSIISPLGVLGHSHRGIDIWMDGGMDKQGWFTVVYLARLIS